MFGRRNRQHTPTIDDQDWRDRLVATEVEKETEAAAAVHRSRLALEVEQTRLRTSREIAADIRRHREANHFTERIAASFRLKPKGGTA